MTTKEYQAMIEASGGFTTATMKKRTGDRPQPLTNSDEAILNKVWAGVSKPIEPAVRATLPEKKKYYLKNARRNSLSRWRSVKQHILKLSNAKSMP